MVDADCLRVQCRAVDPLSGLLADMEQLVRRGQDGFDWYENRLQHTQ
jgi:hypothetical protein